MTAGPGKAARQLAQIVDARVVAMENRVHGGDGALGLADAATRLGHHAQGLRVARREIELGLTGRYRLVVGAEGQVLHRAGAVQVGTAALQIAKECAEALGQQAVEPAVRRQCGGELGIEQAVGDPAHAGVQSGERFGEFLHLGREIKSALQQPRRVRR